MELSTTHLANFSQDAVNFKDLFFSVSSVATPYRYSDRRENLPQIGSSKIK